MAGKNQHVVPSSSGWSVRGTGASRATRVFSTRREALDFARRIARNNGADLIVHKRDGFVSARTSYGNGSLPSR